MSWTKSYESMMRIMRENEIDRYKLEVQGVLPKTWKEGEMILLSKRRIWNIREWLKSKR
jgi:hypothetical protein